MRSILKASTFAFTLFLVSSIAWAAPGTTTTTLAVTNGATPVTFVFQPVAITLTATVQASGTPISPGQVKFCDVSVNTSCTGAAFLGLQQLTSAGTAKLVTRFGYGAHSIRAQFLGTHLWAASQSSAKPMTQNWKPGAVQSAITSAAGSGTGLYDLTVSFTGLGVGASPAAPSGTVSFIDQTNGNSVIGSGTLAATGPAALNFHKVPQALSGNEPTAIVVADFNEDGFADYAVANTKDQTVTIFLSLGNGAFAPPATLSVPGVYSFSHAANWQMFAGDFNGDGHLDLVTTDGAGTVSLIFGHGDGTFETPVAYPLYRYFFAVADLNGDGIDDILGVDGSELVLEAGSPDGSFTESVMAIGVNDTYTTIADVNGDGIPDIVQLEQSSSGSSLSLVYLGNGDGTFQWPIGTVLTAAAGTFFPYGSPVFADVNGDGVLDIVFPAAEAGANPLSGGVEVAFGKGDGTFQTPNVYGTGLQNPSGVALADLNGDGILDVVVINNVSAGYANVLFGAADGSFSTGPKVLVGSYPGQVVVGDVNGDGKPDVFVLNLGPQGPPESASVLLNQWGTTASVTVNDVGPALAGPDNVVAHFPGDSNYRQSTSAPVALTGAPTTKP